MPVLPLIYTHIMYTLLFGLVIGVWIYSELLGLRRWHKPGAGKKRDRSSTLVGVVAGSAGFALAFLFPLILPAALISWQAGAFFGGIALILAGACWRRYAIRTLGQYFTATVMVQDKQPVVQHGAYKYIRHPAYSGALVTIIGVGLMMGNWVSMIVVTGGLFIGLLYRMAVEEETLLQELGPPYAAYRKRTKRLIPYIF